MQMQFYQHILAYFLQQHQYVKIVQKQIVYLLFIFYYSQLSAVISNINCQNQEQIKINVSNFYCYYNILWRPYQYFMELNNFRIYCFLIPTILNVFLIIQLSVFIIKNKLNKIRKLEDQQENNQFISILYQIHFYLFSCYSFDLYIISISECLQNLQTNIVILIISIVFLIIQTIFILINIVCSESNQFPNTPLQPIKRTFFDFIFPFFIIVSIFLNINLTQIWSTILVNLINILILGFNIIKEIKVNQFHSCKISIIILTYSMLENIFNIFIQTYQNQNYLFLILTILPFFSNIFFYLQIQESNINLEQNPNITQRYHNLQLLFQVNTNNSMMKSIEIKLMEILLNKNEKSISNNNQFNKELIQFNKSIMKLNISQKQFWYFQYILIKVAQNQRLQTLQIISRFQESLLFIEELQQYQNEVFNISFLFKLRLKYIKQNIECYFCQTIFKNHDSILDNLDINQFLMYRSLIQNKQNKLQEIFKQKLILYQLLLEIKQSQQNSLYKKIYELSKNSLLLIEQLQQEFKIQKTYRIQQLLVMFYVEFFNNIIQAELLRFVQLTTENTKQNQVEYMQFLEMKLTDDIQNVLISKESQNFSQQIGYQKRQNLEKLTFEELFPHESFEYHQKLIQKFLEDGICKYYNQKNDVIIRGFDNLIFYSEMQLNLQPYQNNGIIIYSFFSLYEEQPRALFINQENLIVGYTVNFLKEYNTLCPKYNDIYMLDISKILKNFTLNINTKYIKSGIVGTFEEFQIEIKNRLDIIEIVIIEEDELIIQIEQEVISKKSISLELNQESIVLLPHILFNGDDLTGGPLSFERPDAIFQDLLNSEGQLKKLATIKQSRKLNSEKNSEPEQKNKIKIEKGDQSNKQMEQNEDKASSKFTRGFLDNSIYFQKHNQLNTYLTKKNKTGFIYISTIAFQIALIIIFVQQFLNLFYQKPKYEQVNDDADMLAVKSNFMTPVHNCNTAQTAVVDYMILAFLSQEITVEIAYQKLLFALDSIYQSYYQLKDSFQQQLNNQNVQSFFIDQQIEMVQIDGLNTPSRNISLKNALFYYYEAQYYITTIDYYTVINYMPTNEFVYFMANVKTLDDHMDLVSNSVKEYIIARSSLVQDENIKLLFKMIFLEAFAFIIGFGFILRIESNYKQLFQLVTRLNYGGIQLQIQRLINIISILQHEEAYQLYQYEIKEFETKIKETSNEYKNKNNSRFTQSYKFKQQYLLLMFSFLGLLIIFILPQIILEITSKSFLEKYINTAQLLNQLSEVSSALTAIYDIREINYMINAGYPFFYFVTDQARIIANTKLIKELEKINIFEQTFPELNLNDYLLEEQFKDTYESIKSENLCDFLIHFNKTLAQEHCDLIYSGVMKLGLYNTLSQIYKEIYQEYINTNGFEMKLRNKTAAFEEVEIGLISSDSILYIQQQVFNGLINKTYQLVLMYEIISYIYIILIIVALIILYQCYLPYQLRVQKITRHFMFIVPHYQLYLDEKFESSFRILQIQQQ